MERRHKKRLTALFGADLKNTRNVALDVPDNYAYMDPSLVERLAARTVQIRLGH